MNSLKVASKPRTPGDRRALEAHDARGHDALWQWFGLSYASWLTMPRVMMHAMPDDWQRRMAQLLAEWDATWDSSDMPNTRVQAIAANGRITKWPDWLLTYRYPKTVEIDRLRRPITAETNSGPRA